MSDLITATALYNAFQNEPFYMTIAKNRDHNKMTEKEAFLKYFTFSIQEAQQYGTIYTLENPAIGASIWQQPLSTELAQQKSKAKKAFLKEQLGAGSLAAYEDMAALMSEKETNLIGEGYWYLSILAVAKQYQQKGYGQQLMRPVLSKIDALKVASYLETYTKKNLLFYGKLGFEVALEYFDIFLKKTCWILIREAS